MTHRHYRIGYSNLNQLNYCRVCGCVVNLVDKLLRLGLEAVHLEAALHPLVGAHDGRAAVVPPALAQGPPSCFTRMPATQVLLRANREEWRC